MTIISENAPYALHGLVADELQAISRARGRGNFNSAVDDAGGGATPLTGAELPLYGMPIAALAEDKLAKGADAVLAAAHRLGWRFLVNDARGPGLVDLVMDHGRDPVAIAIKGTLVERFGKAAERAERDQPEGLFHASVLDFGQLGMSELWLHCPDRDDIFYSLSESEPKRRSGVEVLEEAAARARRQAKSGVAGDAPDDCGG